MSIEISLSLFLCNFLNILLVNSNMKPFFLFFTVLFCLSVFAQKQPYLLVGTYTGGESKGIYVYSFNEENASSILVSTIAASNPSYLAISPDQRFVYAVNEDAGSASYPDGGTVSSFSFNKSNGLLSPINKQFSGGKHPCYVTIDATGKWLFTSNYSSGTIGLFPVKKNGEIDHLIQLVEHKGSGPDTARQKTAHVHSSVLSHNQEYLFVQDLGIDQIMIYNFNNKKGELTIGPTSFAASEPGSGPRHFEFAPNNSYAYLMEEMTGTVVTYKFEDGELKPQQRLSALQENFKGEIGGADIHVSADGNFLYCSNRGTSNSISIFKINQEDGTLTLTGEQSTFGNTPRNFNFDPSGNFLLVANQNSNQIVIFKINKESGLLTDTGKRIFVPSPVCLKWIK